MQSGRGPRRERQRGFWRGMLGLAAAAGFAGAGCSGPRPVAAEVMAAAEKGVSANADWTPAAQPFGGFDMALVPAGCFRMGSSEEQLGVAHDACRRYYGVYAEDNCGVDRFADETPVHEVCFEAPFWIDVYEVTNRAYGSTSSVDLERRSRWPRETVTWEEAQAFCHQRGGRLPTEAEWEYAARGPDGPIYPWGYDYDPNAVVMGILTLMPVGSEPAGASWAGAHDLSGGIQEWTADWYGSYSDAPQVDPTGPAEGKLRVTRGGSWFSFSPFQVRAADREPLAPDRASSTVGFRCVADVLGG